MGPIRNIFSSFLVNKSTIITSIVGVQGNMHFVAGSNYIITSNTLHSPCGLPPHQGQELRFSWLRMHRESLKILKYIYIYIYIYRQLLTW